MKEGSNRRQQTYENVPCVEIRLLLPHNRNFKGEDAGSENLLLRKYNDLRLIERAGHEISSYTYVSLLEVLKGIWNEVSGVIFIPLPYLRQFRALSIRRVTKIERNLLIGRYFIHHNALPT